ncbi:MAG: DUF5618 family protein [Deltaproteobacteria bacterium]|nr:DUF5618 family protein [Deltaproteobacteria bacterium]
MKESVRYLRNAKDILKNAPVEGDRYADVKHVQEACGTAYLAVLKAIDEYLLRKGIGKKELPKSVEAYRDALRRHAAVRNGKLWKELEDLYDELHIAGYYRGMLHSVSVVKETLKGAKSFIEKLGK